MDLPQLTPESLVAHRDLHSKLSQWAGTLHRLVWDRITAVQAAYGPRNHPTETDEEYAMAVLAKGQTPFPRGVSLYDGPSNIAYEHIYVGYGTASDGPSITYTGHFPEWAPDGQSFKMLRAEIHCPAWLVTEADGIARFEAQTAAMADQVRTERAEGREQISRLSAELIARRAPDTPNNGPDTT